VSHEEIAAWEGFAVALVGAAAVLAGLLFVAVSLNMEHILRVRTLPGRAGESVILFLGVLCQCAFLLIAHQSSTALAIEADRDQSFRLGSVDGHRGPRDAITDSAAAQLAHHTACGRSGARPCQWCCQVSPSLIGCRAGCSGWRSRCSSHCARGRPTRGCCLLRWCATSAIAPSMTLRDSGRVPCLRLRHRRPEARSDDLGHVGSVCAGRRS
jgi:hypothetical protein